MNKTEVFINKIITKNNPNHFNKDGSLRYNYSKTIYTHSQHKVVMTCSEHGDFEQSPNAHLSGKGCMSCNAGGLKTTDFFIEQANKIHNNKYSYIKTIYKKSIEKVIITCSIHGDFKQIANQHLNGTDCPKCSRLNSGWTRTDFKNRCNINNKGLGVLYIIRCFNDTENFYKIGITSTSVKKRYTYSPMSYDYEVIHEVHREPDLVYNLENKLLKALADYSYQPSISFKGQTECISSLEPFYKLFRAKLTA